MGRSLFVTKNQDGKLTEKGETIGNNAEGVSGYISDTAGYLWGATLPSEEDTEGFLQLGWGWDRHACRHRWLRRVDQPQSSLMLTKSPEELATITIGINFLEF